MKRVLWIVTAMICSSMWANAQGLTIADMARKERAKRQASEKEAPQKTVTITNSRLKPKSAIIEEAEPSREPARQAATPAPAAPAAPAATTAPATMTALPAATAALLNPPATVTPPAATPDVMAPPAPPAAAPSNQPPARDEKWWRERFEKARTDVRRAENQVAVAELEFNAANREFLTTSFDPDGRGPKAIADSKKKMDDAKKRLDDARAKVVQLEEELRQSGAPAGWAR